MFKSAWHHIFNKSSILLIVFSLFITDVNFYGIIRVPPCPFYNPISVISLSSIAAGVIAGQLRVLDQGNPGRKDQRNQRGNRNLVNLVMV